MTLNDTENSMPSKTKRNGKAGRGFAPRSVMPGVKIVETLRVMRKCGHETDHPLKTPRKWLRAATQRMCLDCEWQAAKEKRHNDAHKPSGDNPR